MDSGILTGDFDGMLISLVLIIALAIAASVCLHQYNKRKAQKRLERILKRQQKQNPSQAPSDPAKDLTPKESALAVLQRPISSLPIDIDFPRICHKIRIIVLSDLGVDLPQSAQSASTKDTITQMRETLLRLSVLLNDNVMQSSMQSFGRYFESEATQDLGKCFARFLKQVVASEDQPVVRILKLVNQCAISIGVVRMKSYLGSKFAYKDERNTWRIEIRIESNPDGGIMIRHFKRERSHAVSSHRRDQAATKANGSKKDDDDQGAIPMFSFEWCLGIVFSGKNLEKISSVDISVLSVDIASDFSPMMKRDFLLKMKEYDRLSKMQVNTV